MHHGQPAKDPLEQAELLLPTADDPPQNRRLAAAFSALVSLALLVMVADQFRQLSFGKIAAMVPGQPVFWLIFAAYYFVAPLGEWVIYRRLWDLPFRGMGALLRKLVSNELLLGYLGDVQFYAWARSTLKLAAAPFGAIKDVTILSALTGNVVTVLLLIPAWPLAASGQLGLELHSIFVSLSVVLVTSFAMLLWRRQLFSLPRQDLAFIAAVHVFRIAAMLALAAAMWHWVLPHVPLLMWLVLASLRMLVSRLPLVPNKDVVFAGLTVFVLGHETDVAGLMTMMAGLILAAHLVVGTLAALGGLITHWRRR